MASWCFAPGVKTPFDMKLLVVAVDFPVPANNGHRLRNWSVLQALALEGHDVSLLCFAPPPEPSDAALQIVKRICSEVWAVPFALPRKSISREYGNAFRAVFSRVPYSVLRFRSAAFADKLTTIVQSQDFDGIVCETCYPLVNFPPDLSVPLILDNHNLEHVLVQRFRAHTRNPARWAYAALEWRKVRNWESCAWQRADRVSVCSEHDREVAGALCDHVSPSVVPNVIDVDQYVPNPCGRGQTILYVGGMDWLPNRDAARLFASEILPKVRRHVPKAHFLVAGRSPDSAFQAQFAPSDVTFTGTVPDMRPVIAEADVCVVPLRIGSGTRLKILEAAAAGKAIVSTPLGAEGLNLRDGTEIILASGTQAFAGSVAHLLSNPEERYRLGMSARSAVEQRYSFPVLRFCLGAVMAPPLGALRASALATQHT
jgi:glycosyltransferase involved in cell wall biosynthesis